MQIVKPASHYRITTYSRSFEYAHRPGAGFAFDCNEQGEVDLSKENPCARSSFLACLTGAVGGRAVLDMGVERRETTGREPAVGLCDCGREVCLWAFTNPCDCGADYNSAGQRLADRSQWGEETGEHWTDCF